jgi:hypothetical protein
VAVAPVGGGEGDDHDPQVREDQVEQQDVARVGAEEEGGEIERGGQDRLDCATSFGQYHFGF